MRCDGHESYNSLEERIKEQGKLVLEMIEKKRSNAVVYKMMEVYEDLYSQLRCPSGKQENDYIHIYWKYLGYMERN